MQGGYLQHSHEKALIWISAGTTTAVWTAPFQSGAVDYMRSTSTPISYKFIASFTISRYHIRNTKLL